MPASVPKFSLLFELACEVSEAGGLYAGMCERRVPLHVFMQYHRKLAI